jgi:hypothetical protein
VHLVRRAVGQTLVWALCIVEPEVRRQTVGDRWHRLVRIQVGECFLERPYRTTQNPADDTLLSTVWHGFEDILCNQLPAVSRSYTTYEDIYERPLYETFLAAQGYTQCGTVAFVKAVPRTGD